MITVQSVEIANFSILNGFQQEYINDLIKGSKEYDPEGQEISEDFVEETFHDLMINNISWTLWDASEQTFEYDWDDEIFYDAVFSAMTYLVGFEKAYEIKRDFIEQQHDVYAREYDYSHSDPDGGTYD